MIPILVASDLKGSGDLWREKYRLSLGNRRRGHPYDIHLHNEIWRKKSYDIKHGNVTAGKIYKHKSTEMSSKAYLVIYQTPHASY